jgi:hypothetical protein
MRARPPTPALADDLVRSDHPAPGAHVAVPLAASNLFMTFAVLCMDHPVKLDHVWAGLCLMGAVHFIPRG